MDKKLKLAVIIAAAVLLALGIFALVLVLTDGNGTADQGQSLPAASTQEPTEQIATEEPESTEESPSESATASTEPAEESPQPVATQKPTENDVPPATTKPGTQKPAEGKELSFPYTIPGSSLVIHKVDSYNGVFLEDGSDRSVSGICTLVLTNSGSTDVEYADISLVQGKRTLLFKATVLRAGCTVVVQEASAALYEEGAYTSCTADVAEVAKLEMSSDKVQILENADGSLTVTNLTNQAIGGIRIFYKFCLTKGSVYVGGITYTAKVENLAPGGTQTVFPNHFSYGSSEVVMVRLYDSL